jgi:hypothetical protein
VTEPDCTSAGTCDDFDDLGCVSPFIDNIEFPIPCLKNTTWTPVGCLIREITSQAECVAPKYVTLPVILLPIFTFLSQWITHATTKEECEAKGIMCLQPVSQTATGFVPQNTGALPKGWSWKNESQCVDCGGVRKSYYSWTPVRIIVFKVYYDKLTDDT